MINIEKHDSITVLRLQYGKANTIDIDLFTELIKQLKSAADSECKAIVLTGTGSIFSAGVDLFKVLKGGDSYLDKFIPQLTDGLLELFTFPKPVVAAVNGHAIAGGAILACACDYRLMVQGDSRIGVPELLVGVPFPTLPLEIVRFTVPNNVFQQVIYFGKTYLPQQALQVGFIDKVVTSKELLDEAVSTAKKLAAIPTKAFQISKTQVSQPVLERFEKYRDIYDNKVKEIWKSQEAAAVIQTYLENTVGKDSK